MNNNTKRRKALQHKWDREGGFPKPGYKRKAKPFPKPDQDTDLSLTAQAKMFYGACYVGK